MSNIAGGCHDVFYIWVGMLVRVRHADIHPAERWLGQRAIGLQISTAVTDRAQSDSYDVFFIPFELRHTFLSCLADRIPPVIVRMLYKLRSREVVWF